MAWSDIAANNGKSPTSFILTSAVGRVTPGRNEKRHMIVVILGSYREAHGYQIKENRRVRVGCSAAKIIAYIENYFINPRN